VKVHVPGPLHSYTGGRSTVEATGGTLNQLTRDLDRRFPGLRFRVVDEQERIRPHVKFFVNGVQVSSLSRRLAASDEVHIMAALSGG